MPDRGTTRPNTKGHPVKKHPLRAHLEAQIKKRKRRHEVTDQDSRSYSAALFVLGRLLDFPFEEFPAHAYPGHLLRHAHIRWHHVEQVIRFCELLKQPKGSKAGQPVRLLGFQVLIIFCILGPEDPDTKLRLARTVVMTIARKNGKLLSLEEPIPTPNGWVKNKDLREGDEVFGVDGEACRVTGAFDTETPEKCYHLRFSDGVEIDAGAEHQWLTRHKWRPWAEVRKGPRKGQLGVNGTVVEQVVTTQQIADSLSVPRPDEQAEWNHSIELCDPVDYPARALLIDPYALGVWLAEGDSSGSKVTLNDNDSPHILARIGRVYTTRLVNECRDRGSSDYRIGERGELVAGLRALHVFKDKHIPEEYLLGSIDQRRALLQGLVDGDGHGSYGPGTSSSIEITTKFPKLRDGILELMRSLGLKPTARAIEGVIDGKVVGVYQRVIVTAYQEDMVASLPRKLSPLKVRPNKPTRARRRRIVACDPITPVPMRCIAVDGPDHLYLAGRGYVVTHNSALVAMIYLAMMSLDCFKLKAQDIQVGASDREQAGILFDIVQKLILLDTDLGLTAGYHIVSSKKTLTHRGTYSRLHCLSSDAYRAHGANPMSVLLDELSNIPDGKAREFYGVLSTAFGSQDEPLLMMFATQAPTDSHLFSEFVDRAKENNRTQGDLSICGFIFEMAKTDDGTGLVLNEDGKTVDHFAEANWTRSNPALEGLCPGGFRSLADLRAKAKEARDMPSQENNFRNLQLNQRITAHAPFISQIAWSAVQQPPGEIPEDILQESPCFVALDLSARRDLTARASVWVLDGGRMYARVRFYTPAEGLTQKAKGDRVPLDTWAAQDLIFATPGKIVDYSIVAEELRDHAEEYPVEGIGFDRWRIEDLKRECVAIGFDPYEAEDGDLWFSIGQGFKDQNPCVEAFEAAVIDRKISVEENAVLTWNMSNAVTVQDPTGARKFEKSKSYGRIDGCVALAMAVWMATQGDLDDRAGIGESVYEGDEGPGLLVL